MDDIIGVLEKAGVPAGLIGVGAGAFYLADKFHIWERPNRKTDRELLSADEKNFRRDLLERVKSLEESCSALGGKLRECEDKHAKLSAWILRMMEELRQAGLRKIEPLPTELLELAGKLDAVLAGNE